MSVRAMSRVFDLGPDAPLSSVQRLVLLAIADHCNDDLECWPGHRRLAHKCGMDRGHAARVVRGLESAGWIERDARTAEVGDSDTCIIRLTLERGLAGGVDPQSTPGVDSESTPRVDPQSTPCRPTVHRGVDSQSAPSLSEPSVEPSMNPSPQPPLQGGRASLSAQDSDAEGVESALAAAYAEAVGKPLPGEWRRKLRRSLRNGNGPLWAGVTATDVRMAIALADRQKRAFGFGWLVNHLTARSARAKTAGDARRKSALAASQREQAEAEQRARAEAETARKREHFASLPSDRQDHYRRQADPKGLLAKRNPQWLDAAAAELAWKDRS